jgi:hypothetical protein
MFLDGDLEKAAALGLGGGYITYPAVNLVVTAEAECQRGRVAIRSDESLRPKGTHLDQPELEFRSRQ